MFSGCCWRMAKCALHAALLRHKRILLLPERSVGEGLVRVCGLERRFGGLVVPGLLLSWGRDLLRAGWGGFLAVIEVLVEGFADGFFPVFGAAGAGELVLG